MQPTAPDAPEVRLFVYGLLLQGEREHALLEGAPLLGEALTAPEHTLVDLDFYPVLLETGATAVQGELYGVSRHLRFKLDVHHQCPALFRRTSVQLADGTRAETYVMDDEKVRGKRRLKGGSWRGRFEPRKSSLPPGPMTQYAKKRFG